MDGGYIKIHRKILDWEWYTDQNTFCVFLHCLFKANWKAGRFRGIEVPRGSFITSLQTLSDELNMSVKSVRTALDHLKATGELASKNYPHWRMITVIKYNDYQDEGRLEGKQTASEGQAKGKQRATIEEYKEGKNIKKGKKEAQPDDKSKKALKEIEELYIKGVPGNDD